MTSIAFTESELNKIRAFAAEETRMTGKKVSVQAFLYRATAAKVAKLKAQAARLLPSFEDTGIPL